MKLAGIIFGLIALFLMIYPFGDGGTFGLKFGAALVVIFNIAAFITAFICYWQFLFPQRYENFDQGEYNHLPFHVFNLIFVLVYLGVSMHFLVENKNFYVGFENLNDEACIKKYYLSNGLSSIAQIFIASSVVVNVVYIITHLSDFYGGTSIFKKTKPVVR